MAEYTLTSFNNGEFVETVPLKATIKEDAITESRGIADERYGDNILFRINETRVVHEFSNPA